MSTTKKKILFTVDVAPAFTLTRGNMGLYQIIDGADPRFIKDVYLTAANIEVELDIDDEAYYYAELRVDDYSLNGGASQPGWKSGRAVLLLSVFEGKQQPDEIQKKVCIGAKSTVAAAYAFNRMLRITDRKITFISGTPGTAVAYGMKNNFIKDDGTVSTVISSSPNGLETNSYPMFNYLSGLVFYCLTDMDIYNNFLKYTYINTTAYRMFLTGLVQMIRNPFTSATDIYNLISDQPEIFAPSLKSIDVSSLPGNKSNIPDQWTLTIKVNRSGADNFLMSGLAFVVFDSDNKAWITNNFRAGTPNSGTHCLVLNSDGSPADFSPLTGGGLLGAAFGAAVNPAGNKIALGNFGWGPKDYNPQFGSISVFNKDGSVDCPPDGHTNGLSRVQGMNYDSKGNLWMASMGSQNPLAPEVPLPIYDFEDANSRIVVYRNGNPKQMVYYENFLGKPSPLHGTFDVFIDKNDIAYVSNKGTKDGPNSSVYKFRLTDSGIEYIAHWESDTSESLRQVVADADGNVYVGAISTKRIIKFNNALQYQTEMTNNINAAWGVNIDREGTMFVANFAHEKDKQAAAYLDMIGPYGVTIIKNCDESQARLMTVPTGGHQVMLNNGKPLYGNVKYNTVIDKETGLPVEVGVEVPCYEPIMRLTATNIDRAGNLWAVNNWKPSAYNDVFLNPGGDGVVIFIGVAAPAL